jgi:ATP-binding cassette subfamily G (WHITE) protein 1
MGASGAGKTSLLNVLAGDISSVGHVTGSILLNGKKCTPADIKGVSEFVFQDDLIFDTMTVREAIWMSAKLRLPARVKGEERAQRVNELIKLLNLEKCQGTIIGSPAQKGISGGERKRCSIAMDMITNPPVLFLDEPTSGLDTFTAYNVMATLRELAHEHGRTVICTIHQPSSEIFHLMDDLLLLSSGQVVYHGSVEDSVPYFAGIGFPCPLYNNPADYFFMEILNETIPHGRDKAINPLDRLAGVCEKWRQCSEPLLRATICAVPSTSDDLLPVKERANFFTQFKVLFSRAFKNVLRNKMIVRVRLFQSVFLSLVIGSVYFDVSKSPEFDTQRMNRAGAMYFLVINQFMSSATGVVTIFSLEKNVFKREHDAGYYRLPAYFISKTLVETPHQVFFPFLVMTIAYWMIGLRADAGHYLIAVIAAVLSSLNGMALGTLAGAFFKDINVGMAILMVILLPLMLFSGFLVNNTSVPVYFRWIQYISPTKYAFNALMQNEFAELTFKNCDVNAPANAVHKCSGNYVLDRMGMSGGLTIWEDFAVLLSTYLILMILAFLALLRLTRK